MEACQRDELELVAHRTQLSLKLGDGGVVEIFLPVKTRRAVVGQHLAGELFVNRLGKRPSECEIGLARLAPDHVGIRSIGQAARDGLL